MGPGTNTAGQLINQLATGAVATLTKVDPCGTLIVRKRSNGAATFYWRYTFHKVSERVAIGPYDSLASPKSTTKTTKGYSIKAAICAAEAMATDHYASKAVGGRPALLAARREALVAHVQLATGMSLLPPPLRLPGLVAEAQYTITHVPLPGSRLEWPASGIRLTGAQLDGHGVQLPRQHPESGMLLHLAAQ